jgi:hypothetical protein
MRGIFRSCPLSSRPLFRIDARNSGKGSAHVLIAAHNAFTSARTITDVRSRSSHPAYRYSVSYSAFSAHLRDLDVLASRALRTLSSLKRDGLPFAKIVETSLTARRAVEEVLVPVTRQDEAEPLTTDEPLDRAVHGRHVDLLDIHVWRMRSSRTEVVGVPNHCPEAGRRWMNAGWLTSERAMSIPRFAVCADQQRTASRQPLNSRCERAAIENETTQFGDCLFAGVGCGRSWRLPRYARCHQKLPASECSPEMSIASSCRAVPRLPPSGHSGTAAGLVEQMWAIAAEPHDDPHARIKAAEWIVRHGGLNDAPSSPSQDSARAVGDPDDVTPTTQ